MHCGGISSIELDGCKLDISQLLSEKTVFFHHSDLVFENGRPVRTKRSYGENKRPNPIIKFQYVDSK